MVGSKVDKQITVYGIKCHILFGITQCNNFLLLNLIFTHESWIGRLGIIYINDFTW